MNLHSSLLKELSREVGGKGRGGLVGQAFVRFAKKLLSAYVPN